MRVTGDVGIFSSDSTARHMNSMHGRIYLTSTQLAPNHIVAPMRHGTKKNYTGSVFQSNRPKVTKITPQWLEL